MILLVDIGNTTIYLGLSDNNKIIKTHRVKSTTTGSEKLFLSISSFLSNIKISDIIISSVVPKITDEFIKMSLKEFKIVPIIINYQLNTSISINTDYPDEVGADLISVAAGLTSLEPTLIVDLGTASKLIYVKDKTIIGVIIMPGIEMSMKSLYSSTSLLPKVSLEIPKKVLGTNTVNCIQSGIFYGSASSIDGLIQRIANELNHNFNVIITGGYSNLISDLLYTNHLVNDELVLQGILNIYNLNKGLQK